MDATMGLDEAAERAQMFGTALSAGFRERGREVRGLMLAAIAGEHVLLLGPPGTAKSALTLAFAGGLGWSSFVRLLGRTTVPEELFGPVSLQGLLEDRYERDVRGYAPTAQVLFLDEALALDTPVPTPGGWTTMGDVQVGDHVLGATGSPVQVLRVTDVATDHPCYRVVFDDGESIVADGGHLWRARTTGKRDWRTLTTQQMFGRRSSFQVPIADPVELPEADHAIDPYLLGAWLGNGNSWTGELTIRCCWVDATIQILAGAGYGAERRRVVGTNDGAEIVSLAGTGFRTALGDAGLIPDRSRYVGTGKRIPEAYLRGSIAQRLRLVQGLMDTDGHMDPGGSCTFTNTNESIVDGLVEVLRSLGIRCSKRAGSDDRIGALGPPAPLWRVHFRADPRLPPFLAREVQIPPIVHDRAIRIRSIEPVPSVPVRCIEVDAADHLFLAGRAWRVTHNCFKASSAILNSLLTLLNERSYDHGSRRVSCPLRVAVGASNELPQDDGLGALYDRFLLRFWVAPIRSQDAFSDLLTGDLGAPRAALDPAALDVLSRAAAGVSVAPLVTRIFGIRAALAEAQIAPSDRRWRKAMGLIQASAVLDGRTEVQTRDLAVLADCLWDRPADADQVRAIVARQRDPILARAEELLSSLREQVAAIAATTLRAGAAPSDPKSVAAAANALRSISEEARRMPASDSDVALVLATITSEARAAREALSARVSASL